MNRTQRYISLLLERLPKYELRSYEHQIMLDRIRDRVSSASDIHAELLYLYQVKDCADFALSLMWIADMVEKDYTKDESTIDEETLVFSKFRQAIGDVPSEDITGTMTNLPSSQENESTPTPVPESVFSRSSPPKMELNSTPEPIIDSIFNAVAQSPESTQPTNSSFASRDEQERKFAFLLEQFVESVQRGNDDRTKLMSEIMNECNAVLNTSSAAEEYKKFCKSIMEFIQYISDNNYFDDVRVMNILSNIQEPFTQWTQTNPNNRAGILNAVNDTLSDFKTMFE